MDMPQGVYRSFKKDNTEYFRVSITFKNKHISLGSFYDVNSASLAYQYANELLYSTKNDTIHTAKYTTTYDPKRCALSFEKWIILVNFRDTGIYFKTPIYLCHKYFIYFLDPHSYLIFDVDDLFYYSNHKIMTRNGYLFVNDYGMQTTILSRYGIKNHSVCNRDYTFANGDNNDYRYGNINVINKYFGVQRFIKNGRKLYKAKIHINGDYIIGAYITEKEAAVAYNKAADLLKSKGIQINFPANYIEDVSSIEYATLYNSLKISKRIRNLQVTT